MKSKKKIKSIIIMALISIASLFFINISFAKTGKVNTETVNLRETSSLDSKILELISINEDVEVLEDSGDWYKVKYKGITGYVRKDLITVSEENVQNDNENVDVQENNNEPTQETNQVNNETNAGENKEEANDLETPEAVQTNASTEQVKGKYTVIEDSNIKILPLIHSNSILQITKDNQVEVIDIINKWAYVQGSTFQGWIKYNALQKIEENTSIESNKEQKNEQPVEQQDTTTQAPVQEAQNNVEENKNAATTKYANSETVNVRKEASTNSAVIKQVSINTPIKVLSENNGWSRIEIDGIQGYISSALLSDTKKETSRSTQTPRNETETNNETQIQNEDVGKQETSGNSSIQNTNNNSTTTSSSTTGSEIVAYAKQFIGSKYVYGGTTPSGFDCSGFTQYVYKHFGISLSRTAAAQYSNGVSVSKANLVLGDLIMFGKSGINHVGIYIGGGQIVHAANTSRGVTTDTINSGYYYNNYVGARRIITN